ncbi:MAG TPA: YncE family protein [Longimicrobiales bacterium]
MISKFSRRPARVIALAAALFPLLAGPLYSQRRFTVDRIAVGGDGGWDYLIVDPAGQRLFVSRGTHVQVVDIAQRKLVGDIANTPGVHGIVIVPELNRGFTTNGRDSTMTVFDATSLAVTHTIQLPARGPDAILYEPQARRIFTMNHSGQSVTAVDPRTLHVIATTPIGGTAEAAASDGHHLFINLEDRSEIAKVDVSSMKLDERWPLAPCEEPTGMAFDPKHHRLFVGCGNKLMAIVNSENGKVVATVPIGAGVDGVAFDPASGLAFSSNGEGSVSVVHEDSPDTYRVVETVPTQRSARTIALDARTHTLYLSAATFGAAPAPAAGQPRVRPPMVPGSFVIVVLRPAR